MAPPCSEFDLVTLEGSSNPVVFRNSRLFAVLPPDAMRQWDRMLETSLKSEDLAFENGIGWVHQWMEVQRRIPAATAKPAEPATAGDLAQGAAAGAILAPIAPILLAGGVVAGAEYALTGGDRRRAREVNEALLDGGSYAGFLSWFKGPDFRTAKNSYEIREYLATEGSFFTGGDYCYQVGFRHGKPEWVAYQNSAIRFHAVRHWQGAGRSHP